MILGTLELLIGVAWAAAVIIFGVMVVRRLGSVARSLHSIKLSIASREYRQSVAKSISPTDEISELNKKYATDHKRDGWY